MNGVIAGPGPVPAQGLMSVEELLDLPALGKLLFRLWRSHVREFPEVVS
jgi:hypothetical protein